MENLSLVDIDLSHCDGFEDLGKITTFIDSTKMIMLYDLKVKIQKMLCIDFCIHFRHGDSIVHDLENTLILSLIKQISVYRCGKNCFHSKLPERYLNNLTPVRPRHTSSMEVTDFTPRRNSQMDVNMVNGEAENNREDNCISDQTLNRDESERQPLNVKKQKESSTFDRWRASKRSFGIGDTLTRLLSNEAPSKEVPIKVEVDDESYNFSQTNKRKRMRKHKSKKSKKSVSTNDISSFLLTTTDLSPVVKSSVDKERTHIRFPSDEFNVDEMCNTNEDVNSSKSSAAEELLTSPELKEKSQNGGTPPLCSKSVHQLSTHTPPITPETMEQIMKEFNGDPLMALTESKRRHGPLLLTRVNPNQRS